MSTRTSIAHRPVPSTLGLRRIALLDGLSRKRLEALARACGWRNVRRGRRIISRAGRESDVYFIAAGRVRVTTYSAAGRQVTFRDFGAGEHFGELSALDGKPRPADVVSLEDSLVAALPREDFARLLAEEPVVSHRLLCSLADQVRTLSERVIDLSTLSVQHRLHVELLRLARKAGQQDNQVTLHPAPRHAELAARVSTTREQVTRELSRLAKYGVVRRGGGALQVPDLARLAHMVDEAKSGA